MRVPFTKMHGLGNDFVVLDAREAPPPPLTAAFAAAVADRHRGIGCDQLVVLERSAVADVRMRIFNADGGEVEACGNASRAVGLLLGAAARMETRGGIVAVRPDAAGIAVDMGAPRFEWDAIPLAYPLDTRDVPIGWETLERPVALSVGNPHVVFFVDDVDAIDLARLGPLIERDPLFPARVNVNVASVTARDAIRLRVWERGAGLTRACGTGACATAVAAAVRGLADRRVTVTLPGGPLTVRWEAGDGDGDGNGGTIVMSGPAAESFRGSFDPADLGLIPVAAAA